MGYAHPHAKGLQLLVVPFREHLKDGSLVSKDK